MNSRTIPKNARWVYNPHHGGKRVLEAVRSVVEERLRSYAERFYAGRYRELDIRFRGQFCYIDVYVEPEVPKGWPPRGWHETRKELIERLRATPLHLCRLRYLGDEDRWSFAFFTYSSERYEPSTFLTGEMVGRPEDAFELSAGVHLA